MLVNFGVPNKLKKGDMLIYTGKKFEAICIDDITAKLNEDIKAIQHSNILLSQEVKKYKNANDLFMATIKDKLTLIIYEILEEVAKKWLEKYT